MTRNPETYDGVGRAGLRRRARRGDPRRRPSTGCDVGVLPRALPGRRRTSSGSTPRRRARSAGPRRRPGVQRIVYLGGLGKDDDDLSPHLRSRREVERLLGDGGRPGDHAAGRHRHRPRGPLLGDDPPARRAAAADGHAAVGQHPHAADRPGRRRPLPRRRARRPRDRGTRLRGRRRRGAALLRHDASGRGGRGPAAGPPPGAAAVPEAVLALAEPDHRRGHRGGPVAGRLDGQRGRGRGRRDPPADPLRADARSTTRSAQALAERGDARTPAGPARAAAPASCRCRSPTRCPCRHEESAAVVRRRRRVVAGDVGRRRRAARAWGCRREPGSRAFYAATMATAAVYTAGGFVSGPLHLGWVQLRTGPSGARCSPRWRPGSGAFGVFYGGGSWCARSRRCGGRSRRSCSTPSRATTRWCSS